VLKFIECFIDRHGYSPTYREIAEGTQRSKAAVHWQVKRLVSLGHLQQEPGKPRTLRPV